MQTSTTVAASAACLALSLWACGGSTAGDGAPSIERFEATPAWGEAPLATELVWQLDSTTDDIACDVDADGDGVFEEHVSPCPQTGSVPATFAGWGKFEPALAVRATGRGESVARAIVYSNHLTFTEGLVFPEDLAPVTDATVLPDSIVLTYDRPGVTIAPGTMIWGTSGPGYIRRVVGSSTQDTTVTLATEPAGIDDAATDGFFGALDVALPLRGATCVADCVPGVGIEIVEASAGARAPLGVESHVRFTFPELAYPAGNPVVRLTSLKIDLGVHVDIEVGVFPPRFTLIGRPVATVNGATSLTASISHTWKLGKFVLTPVPIGPFVFVLELEPEVELSAEGSLAYRAGFSASVNAEVGFRWTRAAGGSAHVAGRATSTFTSEAGSQWTGQLELAARLPLAFKLMDLVGPYVGLEGSFSRTTTIDDEVCRDVTFEVAAYAGAELELWRHIKITIARIESTLVHLVLAHECQPTVDAGVPDARVDAPLPIDARVDAPATIDGAVAIDAAVDAPAIDAPAIDAPAIDAPAVDAPGAPCALPWGGSTPDGTSVIAYQAPSVPCTSSCVSQVRTCSAGVLSGSYGFNACSQASCPPSYTAYGCAGTSYVPSCVSNCYACTTQTGFFAYNDGGCSGLTCFNRFPGYGTYNGNPLVVMFTRSSGPTAHARFFFADANGNAMVLNGNYDIYVKVPNRPPANPTGADPTCAWSLDTAVTYTLYNNAMPAGVLRSTVINQAAVEGSRVLLYSGNLTGAYYITVTNHWPGHTTCGQILLDYVQAIPQ